MFEFPELFGSPYVLPGLIAAVVLLLVVLLLVLRRRRQADNRLVKTSSSPSTATPSRPKVQPTLEPSFTPESSVPPSRSSKAMPAASSLGARLSASIPTLPSVDPLQETLDSLLRGWGELVDEDLARLRIFRPERVIAAITSLELPSDLKKSQFASVRLNQLQAYARTLAAKDSSWARQEQAVPGAGKTVSDTATETTPATTEEELPESLIPPEQPGDEGGQGEYHLSSQDFPEDVPGWPEKEVGSPEGESPSEELPSKIPLPEIGLDEEPPVEEVEELVEVQEPASEEITEVVETVVEESVPTETADATSEDTETALEETETALEEREPALEETSSRTLTAEHLLALPPSDQQRMLVLLDPKELAKVFETGTDVELKKAVIDVLEKVGSPAHLELLQRCLDDPDPAVQLHALAAADRILGLDR